MSSSANKRSLSTDSNGLGILVAATATTGTLIHTAISSTTSGTYDEIWLWGTNNHTSNVEITIEWGDATASHNIIITIPFRKGLVPLIPGLILQNAKTVKIFASVTNVVTISGFVNTITD